MGPTMMNCCRPEQVNTKEHGKVSKRIQILEDGRVPAKEANHGKSDKKSRITRKEYQRLLNKFDMEGFMAPKGLWNLVKKNKALQDRCALHREEGDASRE